jgi:catechol 2,3-dioxygenase-like lactoylglutathione lyase family enzyme
VKLNHLDLQVSDVPAAVDFFERHFELALTSKRGSPAIAFLDDGQGFSLVLQRAREEVPSYPEGFHLGFLVDDVDEVRQRHARLVAAAVPRLSDVIENNRGVMFYVRGPSDLLIEVSCRRPGVAELRRA